MTRNRGSVGMVLVCLALGCGSGPRPGTEVDAGDVDAASIDAMIASDAPVDALAGGPADANVDAVADATNDANVDASNDANVDASADATNDANVDAVADASADASNDANVDANVDAGTTADPQYVVNRLRVPATEAEATALGFDLDGDGAVDNKFGRLFASLASANIQGVIDQVIDQGAAIYLVDLRTVGATTGLWWLIGATPTPPACTSPTDTVCRGHLQGNGRFTLAAPAPATAHLGGTLAGDRFTTSRTGELVLDGAIGANFRLSAGRVRTAVSSTTLTDGVLGGGLREDRARAIILPALTSAIAPIVERDCRGAWPLCCTFGSQGGTLVAFFDTNRDCRVSQDEVAANSAVRNTLAPDIDLFDCTGNVPIEQCPLRPNTDRVDDSLSVGMGFTAVRGTFPQPP